MPETTDHTLSSNVPPVPPVGRSPRDVLDAKAAALAQQTKGVLVGDLRTSRNDDATMIRFGAKVPALDEGRRGILTAIHPNDRDYPVWIHAACFPRSLNVPPYAILTPEQEKEEFVAHDAEQLGRLVDTVLNSDDVAPSLRKLTARATEILKQQQGAPEGNGT